MDEHAKWVTEALGELEGPLTLYAARLTGDADRARDVVQEAFLRLCAQDRASLDGRLRPWLYTVCRRLAIDERRRDAKMATPGESVLDARPAREADPAAAAAARDDAAQARRALEALPRDQRECVELKLLHGLKYREIADVTGLPAGTVGFLIHVGLKALRERLAAGGAL
jgi:RNA polymerase sigma-70 factor (ECF subfamily)